MAYFYFMNRFRGKVQHVDYFENSIEEVEKKETSAFKPDWEVSQEELEFLQENLTNLESLPDYPWKEDILDLRDKFRMRKENSEQSVLNSSQQFVRELKEKLKVNPIYKQEWLFEFIETDVNNLVENIIWKPWLKIIQEFLWLEKNWEYNIDLFKAVINFQRKFTPNNVDWIANEEVLYKIQTFLTFANNMRLDRAEGYYRERQEHSLQELYAEVLKLRWWKHFELFRNIFTSERSDTWYSPKNSAFYYNIEAFDLFWDFEEIYVENKKYIANKNTRKFISEETWEELKLTKESIVYTENLEWTKSLDGLEEFYKEHWIVIKQMAQHLRFTQEYLLAILSIESIFNVTAQSPSGSTGYMQVTWTMFSDFIRIYTSKYDYNWRWKKHYLPILKNFSEFFINLMSNEESIALMQSFRDTDFKDKKNYNATVKKVRRVLKTKRLVEDHPRLNLVMWGTYLKVVHDSLWLKYMYWKKAWYKEFLKVKLDRINEILEERWTKITKADLDDFKRKIENKEFSNAEIRLLLAARHYNWTENIDEWIYHKYYYWAVVYFLSKHLSKQRNAVN